MAVVAVTAFLLGSSGAAFLALGFAPMGLLFLFFARRNPEERVAGRAGSWLAIALGLLGLATLALIIGQL